MKGILLISTKKKKPNIIQTLNIQIYFAICIIFTSKLTKSIVLNIDLHTLYIYYVFKSLQISPVRHLLVNALEYRK